LIMMPTELSNRTTISLFYAKLCTRTHKKIKYSLS